jgi:hypothetical protein
MPAMVLYFSLRVMAAAEEQPGEVGDGVDGEVGHGGDGEVRDGVDGEVGDGVDGEVGDGVDDEEEGDRVSVCERVR